MDITDIISDSITYPMENIKSLMIYLLLGLILGIVVGITGVGTVFSAEKGSFISFFIALIGVIIAILISFLIQGYGLDIVKLGIKRSNASPEVDFQRQVINGVKSFVVSIVYFIVPLIVMLILSLIFRDWILYIVGFILAVIFYLALAMGQCRLAKTEDLSYAIDIKSAIDDLFNIGILKVILTLVSVFVVIVVITTILNLILNALFNSTIASAIIGIFEVYLSFFSYRAMGLLYSEN